MTFEEFIQVLTKELYVWRMARGQLETRFVSERVMRNAQHKLDDAILVRAETIREERSRDAATA